MKKKLRLNINLKSRHVLIILLILCGGLAVTTLTTGIVKDPVRGAFVDMVVPFQNGVNKIGTRLSKVFSGFQDVQKLSEENEALQARVDELIMENNALLQSQTELERLTELYDLDRQYTEYNKVAAQVIAKDSGNWYNTFVINKGKNDGLAVDMNVIAGGGLVGIITETGDNWSEVRAIIDDSSNVSAMVASTSDTCIVSGDLALFGSGKIEFSELRDRDNIVMEGTRIVTSNISTKYLTGLLIGYVGSVSMDANNLTKSGTIIPAADFKNIREVLVITDLKQTKENSD